MKDMANWAKYAVIGVVVWLMFGFRAAILALMGAAAYDMWKFLKKNP